MLEKGLIPYRSIVLFSIIASPIVYLVPGVSDLMGPPPLSGLIFLFGSIIWYPSPTYFNPMHTRHFTNFAYMALIWIAIGALLLFDFPMKYGKKLTISEHLAAITAQALVPFLLFHNYILIIPFPTTPAISILALLIYERRYKQKELNQLDYNHVV